MKEPLKAPFPAFGGKSKAAALIWSRLGNPRNYIEPFFFSGAVLLRRRETGAIETVNDLNHFVANFWRAVATDPEAVARHADWPVNECDLHARHAWLVKSQEANDELAKVRDDPEYFNAKIAGWWCWGACCWIGSGWCDSVGDPWITRPSVRCDGINAKASELLHISRSTVELSQKIPHLGRGRSIHAKRPVISADKSAFGRGVHQSMEKIELMNACGHGVHMSEGNKSGGYCDARLRWLAAWMLRLGDRMRRVRISCGHWSRICDSDSTMTRLGTTGVCLDPPYRMKLSDGTKNRSSHIYANDRQQDVNALCDEVQAWCLKWGRDTSVRIALCGLEGEYPQIDAAGWDKETWKSGGGYGNRTDYGRNNAKRERIWFSPHCVRKENLFTSHELVTA